MRNVMIVLVLAACSSSKTEPPKTEDQLAKEYEDAVVKPLLAKWPGLDVRVGEKLVTVYAATCKLVLPVVQGVTAKPPKGFVVACGIEGERPDWRLFEHYGEMKLEAR